MTAIKDLFLTPEKCHRPWTYWWWPGNSVEEKELTNQMEMMVRQGLGGAIIVPIYAIDEERETIEAFSPRWNALVAHVLKEAKKRDFLIWVNMGGGRLPGGEFVTEESACQRLAARYQRLRGPRRIDADIWMYAAKTHQSQLGKRVASFLTLDSIHLLHRDERNRVRERIFIDSPPQRGVRWIWSLEKGIFDLIVGFRYPTGQPIPHASPGWEGFALDPYNKDVCHEFLDRTIEAFGDTGDAYVDSSFMGWYLEGFEAPGANYTPDLYAEFEKRRGYNLQKRLPDLWDNLDKDSEGVRQDMLRTLAEMQEERFYRPLFEAIEKRRLRLMLQPQGATSDVMSLAGRAQFPMGESIGPRTYEKYIDARGRRFISSAARHAGRSVVPAECYTRLHESRYCVSLELMKAATDTVYLGGVNHVVNHGLTYTPPDVDPPWVYCEPTHIGPGQTWWRHYPHMAAYAARLNAVLQNSESVQDVLMYSPLADSFARTLESIPLKRGLDNTWGQELTGEPGIDAGAAMGRHTLPCADPIDEAGYRFDYINGETLLDQATCDNGDYLVNGHRYRIMVFHRVGYLPLEVLRHIARLIREGCTLVAVGRTPMGLFGKAETEANEAEFDEILDNLYPKGRSKNKSRQVGKGMVHEVETPVDLVNLLHETVEPDMIVEPFDPNFGFVHHVVGDRHYFFIANCSQKNRSVRVGLRLPDGYVEVWNTTDGTAREWAETEYEEGRLWVRLDFGSFDSCVVHVDPGRKPTARVVEHNFEELEIADGKLYGWTSSSRNTAVLETLDDKRERDVRDFVTPDAVSHFRVPGPWQVEFPEPVNHTFKELKLKDWTKSAKTKHFSGTAVYRATFNYDGPVKDTVFRIDLGRVNDVAEVFVNGKPVGVSWKPPRALLIPDKVVKKGENTVEVRVCNLGHNSHLLDAPDPRFKPRKSYGQTRAVRGVKKPEPMPAGMTGPVRVRPYRRVLIEI